MTITKLLTPLTEPMGFFWFSLWLWIGWRIRRRKWLEIIVPGLIAVVMFVFGSMDTSARLLASLERPYAGADLTALPTADAVVMLGGMVAASRNDILGFHVTEAVDRALTAAELIRQGKARALVLGGGGHAAGDNETNEGRYLDRWFETWGLTNAPTHFLGACANTRDEAERVRDLAREEN